MKILFLSRWFPYPTTNGSKLRIYNLLRGLAKVHDVTLLSFADEVNAVPDVSELQAICSNVHILPWKEFNPTSFRARFGFLSIAPRSLIDTFSPEMARMIEKLLSTQSYDLVIASQLSMASYRPYFRNIPAVFEEVEIGLSRDRAHTINPIKRLRNALTWHKLRIYLSQLLNSFQACTVVSEQESELLRNNLPLRKVTLEVIPNCVDLSEYTDHRQTTLIPNQLIFSGSFRYFPNYEAMLWYTKNVHPYVLEEIPNVHLVITGDPENLTLPATQNITLAGYVDDIKGLVSSSWASLAPLLSGGGTRLKILEAMAIGTPVISTSKGKEGLFAQSGEHLLVADEPQKFAENVIRILRDQQLRQQISSNAQQFVRENYDWAVVMPKFLDLIEKVATR